MNSNQNVPDAADVGVNVNASSQKIASPFSTGGGGTVFELKVQASLVAALLVRAHLPGFDATVVREAHLQSEHLGYQTDDALLTGIDVQGRTRRQLWSIKHEVKYTEKDEVFRAVLRDAWADFTDPTRFNSQLDVFILATGPLSASHKHLLTLLEFARAAVASTDFEARLARKGMISQKAREYLVLITKIVSEVAGRDANAEEIWNFLRCFHIVHFDFDQTASQDEARLKSLLALAIRAGSGENGEELWNKIFKWVADGNPRAKSFSRESLPADWQQVATTVAAHFDPGVVYRLVEHSELLMKRVRSTLGPELQLPRDDVVDRLASAFVQQHLTLVAGPAGVGKSAATRMGLQQVLSGAPLFVFQATEFARDHLDQAFADMRVTESLSRISSLFALHPRKFVVIESIERLLESTQREAFFMLLSQLAEDDTWRIILTCRQHAVTQVQDAFLAPFNLDSTPLQVPLLTDEEFDSVLSQVPQLKGVAANYRTRQLLRNPWFLDKACSVDWTKECTTESLDQRRLREILWRQVVVRDDVRGGGINLQRDKAFLAIAVRRARSLRTFVPVAAGEEAAVEALVADELLVQEPRTGAVAPAHDVLEDWALVRWVAECFGSLGTHPEKLFEALGHEFAIRRAYRQWLQESLGGAEDLGVIRSFVDAVLGSANVPPYWKDETIVSVLLSDNAPQFLIEHESRLLADEKAQLKTVIHLLRVACKKPNPLLRLPEAALGEIFGDVHLVPDGAAWSSIIQIIHRNLARFGTEDLPLLLGLLEDWKAGISWENPSPEAAREAALIAIHFWKALKDDYHSKDELKRIASIILAVPQAIPSDFESLVRAELQRDTHSHRSEILEKKLLTSFECAQACRFYPGLVSAFAEKKWGLDQPPQRQHSYSANMDEHFGLPTGWRFEFFPASALQGPFWALLQNNPAEGMELILKLSNVATERFVADGLDEQYGQGPVEITIDVGDGATRKQWANPRLWLLYREGMPGPNVLASALMAVEKWLLDLADAGHELRDLTRYLLLNSNNVAVTAVVASIAMAHPEKVGDPALAVLRVPQFYELDLRRYVDESTATALSGFGLDRIKQIYYNERLESGKLPHRRETLENLACKLQTGALRERVWEIIDDFKAQLPLREEQSDKLKIWRLKLHRMDLRNFEPKQKLNDGRVVFQASEPDADVAEVVEKKMPALKAQEEANSLLLWGMSVLEGRDLDKFDPDRWREMLEKARILAAGLEGGEATQIPSHEGAAGYVAAVCVRDHLKDLTPEERQWCREFLLMKILEHKDAANELVRIQRYPMSSQIAAARVLPLLLDDAGDKMRDRVTGAIAAAITHAVKEVRQYAAASISLYLWKRDPALASACIGGLLDLAQLERCSYGRWRSQNFSARGNLHDLVWQQIERVRHRISNRTPLAEKGRYRFSIAESFSAGVLPLIASIISQHYDSALAQRIYCHIAESFEHSCRREVCHGRRDRDRRNYEAESVLKRQLANFVVLCAPTVASKIWAPFVKTIPANAEEVAGMFEQLIYATDGAEEHRSFWAIWADTRQALFSVSDWKDRMKRERSGLAKLASTLLLDGIFWKEHARDWKPAHGHEKELREIVLQAGTVPRVCKSFIRLLDGVGAFLLPKGLLCLDEVVQSGNPDELIGDRNSLFSLSRILTPFVFSQTATLRSVPDLRDATLRILNAMVDQGSSAAFRMRDFLISPTAPVQTVISNRA